MLIEAHKRREKKVIIKESSDWQNHFPIDYFINMNMLSYSLTGKIVSLHFNIANAIDEIKSLQRDPLLSICITKWWGIVSIFDFQGNLKTNW